jgi:hypothetical protein
VSRAGDRGAARLFIGGVVAGLLTLGALTAPANAASSGWESILGGHIRSGAEAKRIAAAAAHDGFKVHVQKISSTNWEAEIFNGGASSRQAQAVCAKARKFSNLPHCSVEQEFHGNGWD